MLNNEINRGSRTVSFIVFSPHRILLGSEMKKNEMGCTRGSIRDKRIHIQGFGGETEGKKAF
jgi:hypothetical protein